MEKLNAQIDLGGHCVDFAVEQKLVWLELETDTSICKKINGASEDEKFVIDSYNTIQTEDSND